MANPYIGNTPTNVPLTSDQLADGIVTTAKLGLSHCSNNIRGNNQ